MFGDDARACPVTSTATESDPQPSTAPPQGVVDAWRTGNYGKLAAAIERLIEVLDEQHRRAS